MEQLRFLQLIARSIASDRENRRTSGLAQHLMFSFQTVTIAVNSGIIQASQSVLQQSIHWAWTAMLRTFCYPLR